MADDNKKIGGVSGTSKAKGIEKTESVSEVEQVRKADSVSGVGGISDPAKRRATRAMTLAEREELFKMVDEEAKRMFGDSEFSEQHKQVVQQAVKMVIDAAVIDEPDDDK
jgi:hypothetical protein